MQSIDVGYHKTTDTIGYLKIINKNGEGIVEWGSPATVQIETRTFPEHYVSINLVGCLSHNECTLWIILESAKNPNEWYLSGIGFNIRALIQSVSNKKVKSIGSKRIRRIQMWKWSQTQNTKTIINNGHISSLLLYITRSFSSSPNAIYICY